MASISAAPSKPPPSTGGNELTKVLLAAVAKETPWVAIIGAGLAGAAKMFLNRNKTAEIAHPFRLRLWTTGTRARMRRFCDLDLSQGSNVMLGWALAFLILALVAGYMGFFGLAGWRRPSPSCCWLCSSFF